MARPFTFDKQEVLQKAMVLFWEGGYSNTSFPAIVKKLKLNRSSIYNTFSDKRLLFIEALQFYISKESAALTNTLQNLPPTPDSIRRILLQIAEANYTGLQPKGCLVVNSSIEFSTHDSEIKMIIENNVKTVVSAFTDFISQGQIQGSINSNINAGDLANALFHQITALRVSGKVISDKHFFEDSIKAFIQLFIKS